MIDSAALAAAMQAQFVSRRWSGVSRRRPFDVCASLGRLAWSALVIGGSSLNRAAGPTAPVGLDTDRHPATLGSDHALARRGSALIGP